MVDNDLVDAIRRYEETTGHPAPTMWLMHTGLSTALEALRAATESGEELVEPDLDSPDGRPCPVA